MIIYIFLAFQQVKSNVIKNNSKFSSNVLKVLKDFTVQSIFVIQAWKEQIHKAKDLYEEAKTATTRSLLAHRSSAAGYYFTSYGEDEDDLSSSMPLGAPANKERVRRGSFRGSRMSSIGHSYSGSVDLNLNDGSSSPQLVVNSGGGAGGVTNVGGGGTVRRNRSFELQVKKLKSHRVTFKLCH